MSSSTGSSGSCGAMRSAMALAGWLGLCFAVATLGGFFLPGEWYARLQKPAWNPPNWIFAPVWSALYVLMAVAAWLVWRRGGWACQRKPLLLFLLQLVLNGLWSPLFFGLHLPGLALVDLLLLWVALLLALVAFWRARRPAGILLLPYLGWVSFAGRLNFALWRLN
jgi:translocator protein